MSSAREAGGLPAGSMARRRSTPEFAVLGVEVVEDAAAPTLRFRLGVSEPTEREIFTIALTAQINVEPARRDHDAATRERLVDLFGEPERWPATTHPFLWAHADDARPDVHGRGDVHAARASTFDLEVAAARYFSSLPDGEVPLAFHFSGSILLRGEDGRVQVVSVPWSCTTTWRMPVATWREMMRRHYPGRSWVAPAGGHGRAPDRVPPRARAAFLRRLRGAHARARPGRGARCVTRQRTRSFEELLAHAAVGGLRALPVHARRDQERDADAVRHRLPAGLCGHDRGRARDSLALRGLAHAGA